MTLVFSNSWIKIPKQGNAGPKFQDSALQKTLHFEKFEGPGVKYDNSLFKPQLKNTQIRHF